jgi:hypothetical protein
MEAQTKLSQRAEAPKLPDNATPEQIGEWRKGLGVPEVAKDAKPEAFLDAYKIKVPDGYEMSSVEKGMLGDYAKTAYENGDSPREVKRAVDFFFKQQAATTQAMNRHNVGKQQEWQSKLKEQYGRDFEARIAGAEAYLSKHVPESDRGELLRAQLPGGGYLGDHPAFVAMVSELAAANGFNDRIEANAIESGGRSLAEQQRELEALRTKDRAKYNEPGTQDRLRKLIALRQGRGEIDDWGNERKRA